MKMLAMCVAVALVASGAMAATTIKMVDQATGLSELDVTAPGVAGSVRTINIFIETDENPGLISWGINGLQPPGAGFMQTARILAGNYAAGDAFNWDSTGGLTTGPQAAPKAWPALPGLSIGTICYIDTSVEPAEVYPATSGQAMSFTLTLPAGSVPLGAFTGQSVYAGTLEGSSLTTFVPLVLTPEPVSALLLLAGLPLLRRRR